MSHLDIAVAAAMTHPFYALLVVMALGGLLGAVAAAESREDRKRGACR